MNTQTLSRLTTLCLVAGVITAAALSGCAKKTIVGKWTGTLPGGPAGMSLPATLEFKADGTEAMSATALGKTIVAQGTYMVKDDTLSQTITSVSLGGQQMPVPAGKSQDATIKLDGDTLTLTPKNQTGAAAGYSLKRVAE